MTTLYRLYEATGRLLYVGITGNPGRRFEQHAHDKPWWSDVTDVKLEHHPTRQAALEAERDAILTSSPLHNIVHNTARAPLSMPTRRPPGWISWHCDHCSQEINDGDGYVELTSAERRRCQTTDTYTPAIWHVTHRHCDPHAEEVSYWIRVERIRTFDRLDHWDDHLSSKPRFAGTTWAALVEQIAATGRWGPRARLEHLQAWAYADIEHCHTCLEQDVLSPPIHAPLAIAAGPTK